MEDFLQGLMLSSALLLIPLGSAIFLGVFLWRFWEYASSRIKPERLVVGWTVGSVMLVASLAAWGAVYVLVSYIDTWPTLAGNVLLALGVPPALFLRSYIRQMLERAHTGTDFRLLWSEAVLYLAVALPSSAFAVFILVN